MEWLKDPKNQPKVAIVLSAFIVLMGVLFYFLYIKGPSTEVPTTTADTSAQTSDTNAGLTPPVSSGGPAATETASSAPAGGPAPPPGPQAQVVSADPMEAWRSDPFLPVGYKPPKARDRNVKPIIKDFPFARIPVKLRIDGGDEEKPELPQPVRRMAGILVNNRVYAIIETNGEAEIVQPGDTLRDRLAVVEKIERDKVVLKTKDEKPRYIVVRMAASPRQPTVGTETPTARSTVREPMGAPGGRGYPGVRRTREGDLDLD